MASPFTPLLRRLTYLWIDGGASASSEIIAVCEEITSAVNAQHATLNPDDDRLLHHVLHLASRGWERLAGSLGVVVARDYTTGAEVLAPVRIRTWEG